MARAEIDWERLGLRARQSRCEGIVFAALVAARETVGCALPEGTLAGLGLRAGRARLLELLVNGARAERKLALLLVYASLHPGQAWRSLRVALAHRG